MKFNFIPKRNIDNQWEKNLMFHDLCKSLHGKTDMPHESWGISILNCNFDFILIKTPIILTLDFNYFSPLLGIMEYIFYETRGTLPGAPSLLSSTAI